MRYGGSKCESSRSGSTLCGDRRYEQLSRLLVCALGEQRRRRLRDRRQLVGCALLDRKRVYYDGLGDLVYAGKVGTGFDRATLVELRRRLERLGSTRPALTPAPKVGRGVHWARPELVVQVSFAEWTSDGKLRHPRFEGLREDKAADEVHRGKPTREERQ